MSTTIDKGHNIPVYSPTCSFCKHFRQGRSCVAFKEIPLAIWLGKSKHRSPVPGDHGIRFEPVEEKT